MSIHILDHVFESSQYGGSKLLLMIALADYANNVGVAWPNIGTLATKTRLSERAVFYLIRALASGDQPELIVFPGRGRGRANVYQITLPIMERCEKCLDARKINAKAKGANFAPFRQTPQEKGAHTANALQTTSQKGAKGAGKKMQMPASNSATKTPHPPRDITGF